MKNFGRKQLKRPHLLIPLINKYSFLIFGLVSFAYFARYSSLDRSGHGIVEAAVACFVYLWLFLIFLKIRGGKKEFIWKLLGFIFWFKILLAFLNYSVPLFPPTQDALQNNEMAIELASAWREGELVFDFSKPVEPAYVLPMTIIYFIFGYNLYLGCLFNILAATTAIYFVYRIALLLFGQKEAIVASILCSFMPYLNFMSFFLNREIIVISLMVIMGYLAILWVKENRLKHKATLCACIAYLTLLRPEDTVVLIIYFSFLFFVNLWSKKIDLMFPLKISAACMFLIVGIPVVFHFIFHNVAVLQHFHLKDFTPESLYVRAYRHTHFGFAYLPEEIPGSWLEVLFSYGPFQAINFLMRPFPWEVFRFNQIFLVFNNLILYFLYMLSVLGVLRLILAGSISLFLGVFSFLLLGVFSSGLVQGNAFAAARHREEFIFFIYVLASSGLVTLWRMATEASRKVKLSARRERERGRSAR